MGSNKKPPGNIHKIREFELEKIRLADEFDILQIVGEGWFGKILLVEHRATDTEMVLKALPKPYVSLRDFYREFHYGLHLGIHKNIVTTYDVAFETAGFYVFTQEYAPLGDLTSNMSDTGIGELHSKRVAKQIASALDYMHSKGIVHRDVKLDNVLIYRSDFSRVKLCDFGESFESGRIVERRNEWLPYSPPEVLQVEPEGTYKADPSHDVWQFAIVIFVCLTGCLPWQKAASDDPRYMRYLAWQNTNMILPLRRTPKLFKLLSNKGAKLFRKFLEPVHIRRPKNLTDLSKFSDDRWLAKGAEKDMAENEQDVLCPSMYSFHSCAEEKNKLLSTLAEQGIETTVDRVSKKNRIKDWIESSVIVEDDEEEESGSITPPSTISRGPVAGHISSVKAEVARREIKTTIKDASNKHFDPRTGALQVGPSEMGTVTVNRNKSLGDITTNGKNGSFDSGSIITLASRNDLILSEGQSFHSELNLYIGEPTSAEPMVNARLNVPHNTTSSSNYSINNINNNNFTNNNKTSNLFMQPSSYNESYNFSESLSNSNNTNNNMLQRKSLQQQQQLYQGQQPQQQHQQQLDQYKHYSSSALNVYNNNYYDNNNFNFNSNSSKTKTALSSNFQSLATISVPEINRPSPPSVNYNINNNNRPSYVKDSGYGSNEKLRMSESSQQISKSSSIATVAANRLNKQISTSSSLTNSQSSIIKDDGKYGGDAAQLMAKESRNSMKDTAYDRVKVINRRK